MSCFVYQRLKHLIHGEKSLNATSPLVEVLSVTDKINCQDFAFILFAQLIECSLRKNREPQMNLGLHASNPDSGLCAVGDGLLVSRVEDVDELCVVCSRRAVVKSCKMSNPCTRIYFKDKKQNSISQ